MAVIRSDGWCGETITSAITQAVRTAITKAVAAITITSTFEGHGRIIAAPRADEGNKNNPKPSRASRRNARTTACRGVAAVVVTMARSGAAANVQYNHSRPAAAITRIRTKVAARTAVPSFNAAVTVAPSRSASER